MSRNHERQMQAELTSSDVQAPFEPLGNVEYRGHAVVNACMECGDVFRNEDEAYRHSVISGHRIRLS